MTRREGVVIVMQGFGDVAGDLRRLSGQAGLRVDSVVETGILKKTATITVSGEEEALRALQSLLAAHFGPESGRVERG